MHPLFFLAAFALSAFFVVREARGQSPQQLAPIPLGPGDTDPVWLIPAALVTRAVLLRRLEDVIVRMALKRPISRDRMLEGVRMAAALRLPLTSKGLAAQSALPTVELWPDGGKTSVADHIKRVIANGSTAGLA